MVKKPTYEELERRIEEMEHAARELAENEQLFLRFAENINELFYAKDLRTGSYEYFNTAAFDRIFGISVEKLYEDPGYVFDVLVLPGDRERVKAAQQRQDKQGEWFDEEYRILRPDGTIRWVWARSFPVPDSQGQVNRIVGIAEDITERRKAEIESRERVRLETELTERKRAEEELRKSEEKYRTLTENVNLGVYRNTPGPEGQFIEVNPAIVKMFGYKSRKEMLSINVTDTYQNPKDREKISDKLIREGLVRGEELRLKRKDGTPLIGSVSAVAVKDEKGRVQHYDGIVEDITERKQVEGELRKHREHLEELVEERTGDLKARTTELEQANTEVAATNKELEAFAYSVSHDLRAPLRSIDGFSQALMEDYPDKLDEQGKGYLQRVRSASQRMGILIDDLLSLSRVTRSEMRRETVDLSALAQSIAEELQETQPERQVDFVIAPGLTASGDAQLLHQLMENLLGNAWKFTGQHPKARIEFGTTQVDGKETFFIRDDGVGFDMTYADKLFGVFQRLHSQEEFPGAGVGLSTVQRIAHRHGGQVWAEGKVEEGATFYFTLE